MFRIAVVMCVLAGSALANVQFSSKTTALYPSKECKTKGTPGEGQDPVLLCPAPNGYEVVVFFSAENTHVGLKGHGSDLQIGGKVVGNKLEWRLAGGKPFAVIVAVDKKLAVRGLAGFTITAEIDEKRGDAWVAARLLADAAYKLQTKTAPPTK